MASPFVLTADRFRRQGRRPISLPFPPPPIISVAAPPPLVPSVGAPNPDSPQIGYAFTISELSLQSMCVLCDTLIAAHEDVLEFTRSERMCQWRNRYYSVVSCVLFYPRRMFYPSLRFCHFACCIQALFFIKRCVFIQVFCVSQRNLARDVQRRSSIWRRLAVWRNFWRSLAVWRKFAVWRNLAVWRSSAV